MLKISWRILPVDVHAVDKKNPYIHDSRSERLRRPSALWYRKSVFRYSVFLPSNSAISLLHVLSN